MAKRKNGEGTFGQRTINGRVYKYYKFPDGHFVYGKTATDRDKKIEAYKNKLAQKIDIDLDISENKQYTFGEYCMLWLYTKKDEIAGATYDNYYIGIQKRIIGFKEYPIGNEQLISLKNEMFEEYLKLLGNSYSKATVNKTWMIIKQILKYGIKNKVIPRIDIQNIAVPKEKDVKVKKKTIKFITPKDMERIYNTYISKEREVSADMVVFIMYSGVRVSEAIAATWEQVSEDFSSIYIDRASTRKMTKDEKGEPIRDDNGHIIYEKVKKEPKSEAGKRIIPLPKRAKLLLKKIYEKYPHNKNNLIFPSPQNGFYDRGTINRMIIKLEKESGCTTHYTPHALRHGYGSILISKGVDIKIVSKLLGHADITTTYNIYIGVLKEDTIKAIKDVFD